MELNVCVDGTAARPSQIELADCACVSAGRLGHRGRVSKQMQSCKCFARLFVIIVVAGWPSCNCCRRRRRREVPEGADKEMRVAASLADHPKAMLFT